MQQSNYSLNVILVIIGIRKLRDLTQFYVAVNLKIDRSSYTRIETAKATFTHDRLKTIAECLNTTVSDIVAIADLLDYIEIKSNSIDEIQRLIFDLYDTRMVKTNFTRDQLKFILLIVKRFYSKVSENNTKISTTT